MKMNFFAYAICISALHCVEGEKTEKKLLENFPYRVLKKKRWESRNWSLNIKSKRFKTHRGKDKYVKWTNKGKDIIIYMMKRGS